MKDNIKLEVYQQDWIPGFAAYLSNKKNRIIFKKDSPRHIVLNIGGLLGLVVDKNIKSKELPYIVAECILHEVVHALEEWANVEFSEEKVEKLIEKYRKKYSKKK